MDRIVFFDGVCGLCNSFVDFLMKRDRRGRLRYATLQGETAAEKLKAAEAALLAASGDAPPADADPLRSVVVWDETGIHRKSDGALRAIAALGGIWSLASLFRLVPRFVRDLVYDFIARNRYRWFGKHETCRLPTPAERDRFLP